MIKEALVGVIRERRLQLYNTCIFVHRNYCPIRSQVDSITNHDAIIFTGHSLDYYDVRVSTTAFLRDIKYSLERLGQGNAAPLATCSFGITEPSTAVRRSISILYILEIMFSSTAAASEISCRFSLLNIVLLYHLPLDLSQTQLLAVVGLCSFCHSS